MNNSQVNFILVIFSIYLFIGLLLFIFQRQLMYFPSPKIEHSYHTEIFENENQAIDVIVLNKEKNHAILYFGGNAESVVNSAQKFSKIFPAHAVYLVNYRGYGASTGEPEEQALYSDAQTILNKIKQEYSRVTVMGRSLGSGVATFLAANNKIDKLILITPYDSILNIAQGRFPIYPMSILLIDRYDSLSRVQSIEAKTLVIIADNDQVIPSKNSQRLIKEFQASQIIVESIKDSDHNNLSEKEVYGYFLHNFTKNDLHPH